MEKQADVLKTNPSHLKACILYEVLQRKPVFDSYRSCCKIIGDGVMDYFDFEYWFYRFYNGKCDFDYDRSQDPKQKSLVELPMEILSMITEEIEPMERVLFSTVGKAIKGVCDITPTKFENVKVFMFAHSLHLHFDKTKITYSRRDEVSCQLKINDGAKRDVTVNFYAAARRTINRVLNMPNLHIEHLTFDDDERCSTFSSAFPLNLHVKSVEITTCQPNDIITTMAFLKTRNLEKIKLFSYGPAKLDVLLESRHFTEAKEVNVAGFGSVTTIDELKKFTHLEKFGVTFDMITPEIVTDLRDMLCTSKAFKSCFIASRVNNISALGQALGANVPGTVKSVIHRTHIQGTSDFLEFNIGSWAIWVMKKQFKL